MHTYTRAHKHSTYTHTCMHTCMHACIHLCTHTRTGLWPCKSDGQGSWMEGCTKLSSKMASNVFDALAAHHVKPLISKQNGQPNTQGMGCSSLPSPPLLLPCAALLHPSLPRVWDPHMPQGFYIWAATSGFAYVQVLCAESPHSCDPAREHTRQLFPAQQAQALDLVASCSAAHRASRVPADHRSTDRSSRDADTDESRLCQLIHQQRTAESSADTIA